MILLSLHSFPMNKFLLPLILCLTLSACGQAPADDKVLKIQEYTQIMKTGGELTDPVHGKEVKFFYGAVSGTEGTNANGLAYVRIFEDGASSVTVNLNIELAPAGTKYIAYIQNSGGDASLKIGELESIVGDVRHTVKLVTDQDASTMLSVKIRREGRGESILVAEGTMKAPAPAK